MNLNSEGGCVCCLLSELVHKLKSALSLTYNASLFVCYKYLIYRPMVIIFYNIFPVVDDLVHIRERWGWCILFHRKPIWIRVKTSLSSKWKMMVAKKARASLKAGQARLQCWRACLLLPPATLFSCQLDFLSVIKNAIPRIMH